MLLFLSEKNWQPSMLTNYFEEQKCCINASTWHYHFFGMFVLWQKAYIHPHTLKSPAFTVRLSFCLLCYRTIRLPVHGSVRPRASHSSGQERGHLGLFLYRIRPSASGMLSRHERWATPPTPFFLKSSHSKKEDVGRHQEIRGDKEYAQTPLERIWHCKGL